MRTFVADGRTSKQKVSHQPLTKQERTGYGIWIDRGEYNNGLDQYCNGSATYFLVKDRKKSRKNYSEKKMQNGN